MTIRSGSVRGRTGAHGFGLKTRIALLVAALVAVVSGITVWSLLAVTTAALERGHNERLAIAADDVSWRLERLDVEITDRLTRVSRHVLGVEPELVERLLDVNRDSEVVRAASRVANEFGLDLLEFLDARGEVLSSAHWPERVGGDDEAALRLPEGRPIWGLVDGPTGRRLTRVVRHRLDLGSRHLILVGGAPLDEERLAALLGRQAVAWLVFPDGDRLSSGRFTPAGMERPFEAAPDREILSGEDGASWTATTRTLNGVDGRTVGQLWIAIDRGPLETLATRLRWLSLGLILLESFIGVVAGGWIARRATRPVDETIRAVDAIAAGEADYSFPGSAGDDLEALPEAFSRMQRSLDDQQRRRAAAERVAAWREVARRVAHEIKNPLAPIRLTIENLMKSRRQAPDMFDEILEEGGQATLEEVEQLQRIATEFSDFARLPEPRYWPTDLDALVDSVLALYSHEPGLRVDRRRATPLPPLPADGDLLARAVKNLVANAVEAMGPAGGRLTVETGSEGDAAFLRILDTGPGFDAEAGARLFEPYFTTKTTGTGLGMAIAYRIVAEHGGFITASNRSEGGAEVVVRLPVSRKSGVAS